KVASRCPLDASPKEQGRSMVEMLGVLAIIGVLSVGAIAGYSKAMFKYKLNKQAEQLNTVINAVASNAHNFANLKQGANLTGIFIKMGEIPKEMAVSYDGKIYDIFKNAYYIAYELYEDGPKRVILFMEPQLKTKSTQNLEICRNILITAKENSGNITQLESLNGWNTDDYNIAVMYGDQKCAKVGQCLKDLTLNNIYDICTMHIGKKSPHLKIKWDL
ncbi:MAG: type II secretion system protein, partial [Alphaproteobacteria bacterium]|nr:type II secretion system protein [Alphaproteobacteria bacterium]